MDRDSACKIEGMLMASRTYLLALADAVTSVFPSEERREVLLHIGESIASLGDASRVVYRKFPDLNPFAEQERVAEEMRKNSKP